MSKKIISIILVQFFILTCALAQVPADELFFSSRLNGMTKLHEIMSVVDSFYEKNPDLRIIHRNEEAERHEEEEEFENDKLLFWKRWELYQSSHLDENGDIINTTSRNLNLMLERQAYDRINNINRASTQTIQAENNTSNESGRYFSTGRWTELGPQTFGTIWGTLQGNGRIDRIAFHPTNSNIIYAGTHNGGLWRTTDGGANWTPLSSYMANLGVSGIVISRSNPNTLYVLTGDGDSYAPGYLVFNFGFSRPCGGVLKSTDGGVNWSRVGSFGTGNFGAFRLEQHPSNSNILMAATSLGLYRTTDGGATWTQVISGRIIQDVRFNPLNGNTVYAAGPSYYRYSNDGGITWNSATFSNTLSGANRISIGVTPNDTTRVYLLCGPGTSTNCSATTPTGSFFGLYSSTNTGKTFTRVLTSPNILGSSDSGNDCDDGTSYCLGIAVSPTNKAQLAMCSLSIWASNNSGGSTYHIANYWGGPNEDVHPDVHCVEYNSLDGKLYTGTDGGLYVSNNDGTNWSFISNGLNCNEIYHFSGANDDRTHLAIGLQDNGTRNRTTYTNAFNHIASGDGFNIIYDPNNSSRLYQIINSGGSRVTSDGATRDNRFGFTNFFPSVGRHPTTTANLIVGRSDSIFTTSNEGASFTKNNIGGNRRIVYAPSNPNTIYTANNTSIWKSTNGGTGWSTIHNNTGFPSGGSYTITCLAVNPTNSNRIMVTFGGYDSTRKVIYSSDGGLNWSNFSDGLPNVPVNSVVLGSDDAAYIGTDDGVYYQSPTSTNWLPFYNDLPRVAVTDLVLFPTDGYIYASTFGRGIWYSPLKESCADALSLSGVMGGRAFYQASNITSTQTVTGIDSTIIFYRGSNSVVLQPGFSVTAGNLMKAYIGDCDNHGLPVFRQQNPKGTSLFYPGYMEQGGMRKKNGGWLAYLEYSSEEKVNNKIRIINKEAGDYLLILNDHTGRSIRKFELTELEVGTKQFSLDLQGLSNGLYYIELRRNNQLCHFLEWMKD